MISQALLPTHCIIQSRMQPHWLPPLAKQCQGHFATERTELMKIKHVVQSHTEPDLKPTSLRSYCVSVLATVRDYTQVYFLRHVIPKLLLPLVLPLKCCHQLRPLPLPMSSLRLQMCQFHSSRRYLHPHWTSPIPFVPKTGISVICSPLMLYSPFPHLLKPLYERKERAIRNCNR